MLPSNTFALIALLCSSQSDHLAKIHEKGSISTTCGYLPPLYTNHDRSSISESQLSLNFSIKAQFGIFVRFLVTIDHTDILLAYP